MKLNNMFNSNNTIKLIYLLFLIANSLLFASNTLTLNKMQSPLEIEKQNISKEIDFILGKLKSTKLSEIPSELKKKVEGASASESLIDQEIEAVLAQDPILMKFGKLRENLDTYLSHYGNATDVDSVLDKKEKKSKKDNKKEESGEIAKMKNLHSIMKKISDKITASSTANKRLNATKHVNNKKAKLAEKSEKSKAKKIKGESANSAVIKSKDKKIAKRINSTGKKKSVASAADPGRQSKSKSASKKPKSELDKLKKLHKRTQKNSNSNSNINKISNKNLNHKNIKHKSSKSKKDNKHNKKERKNKKEKLAKQQKSKKNTNTTKIINDSKDLEVIEDNYEKDFERLAQQNLQKLNNTAKADNEEDQESNEKIPKEVFKSDFVDQDEQDQEENKASSGGFNNTEAFEGKIKNENKKDDDYEEKKEIKKLGDKQQHGKKKKHSDEDPAEAKKAVKKANKNKQQSEKAKESKKKAEKVQANNKQTNQNQKSAAKTNSKKISKTKKPHEAKTSSIKKVYYKSYAFNTHNKTNKNEYVTSKKELITQQEYVDSSLARSIIPKASEKLINTLEKDFGNLNSLESEINKTNNQLTDEIMKIASSAQMQPAKKIEKILEFVSSIKSLINQENKIVNMKKTLLQRIFIENAQNAENIQFIKTQIAQNLGADAPEKAGFDVNKVFEVIASLKKQIDYQALIKSRNENSKNNKNIKNKNDENVNKISNRNSPIINNYIILNKGDLDAAFGEEADYTVEEKGDLGENRNEGNVEKFNNNNNNKGKAKKTKSSVVEKESKKKKHTEDKKVLKAASSAKANGKKKVVQEKSLSKNSNSTETQAVNYKKNIQAKEKGKGKGKAEAKTNNQINNKKAKKESKHEKKAKKDKKESKANKKQKLKENEFNNNNKNATSSESTKQVVQDNEKSYKQAEKKISELKTKKKSSKANNKNEKIKAANKTESASEAETTVNNKNKTSAEETKTKNQNKTETDAERENKASALNATMSTIMPNNNNKTDSKSNTSMPSFLESKSQKMKSRKFKTKNKHKSKNPFIELSSPQDSYQIFSSFDSNQRENETSEAIPISKALLNLKKKLKNSALILRPGASESQISSLFLKAKAEIESANLFLGADAQAFEEILAKEEFEISDVDLLKKKSFKFNNFIEILSDFYKHLTLGVANLKNEFLKQKTLDRIKRNIDILYKLKTLSIMYMRSLHVLNKNVLSKKENEDYLKKIAQKLLEVKMLLKDFFAKVNEKRKPENAEFLQIKEYKEKINRYLELYKSIKIRDSNISVSNSIMRKIIATNANILKEETFVGILDNDCSEK